VSLDKSVGIVMRLRAVLSRVRCAEVTGDFSRLQRVQTPLGASEPSVQQAMGDHLPELKRSVRGTNHSPASAKVKNEWSCISTPPLHFVECTGTYSRLSNERYFQVDGVAANETGILLNIRSYFVVKTNRRCVRQQSYLIVGFHVMNQTVRRCSIPGRLGEYMIL
jgi:hypothetical protein